MAPRIKVFTFEGKPLGLSLKGQEVVKVTPGGQAQRHGVCQNWTLVRVDVEGQQCNSDDCSLSSAMRALDEMGQFHLSFRIPADFDFSRHVLATCIGFAADGVPAVFCMLRTVAREWNACVVEDVLDRVHNARKLIDRDEMDLLKQVRKEVSYSCTNWMREWRLDLETARVTNHQPSGMQLLAALIGLAVPQCFNSSSAPNPTEIVESFFASLPHSRSGKRSAKRSISRSSPELRQALATGVCNILPATGTPQMHFAQALLHQYSDRDPAGPTAALDDFSVATYQLLEQICAEAHKILPEQRLMMVPLLKAEKTISTLGPLTRVSKPSYMLCSAHEREAADAALRASWAPPELPAWAKAKYGF